MGDHPELRGQWSKFLESEGKWKALCIEIVWERCMCILSQSLNSSLGESVLLPIFRICVSYEPETQTSSYPFVISTQMSHRHLQLNVAKTESLIFPSSLAHTSLLHLSMAPPSTQLPKPEAWESFLTPPILSSPTSNSSASPANSLSRIYLTSIYFSQSWELLLCWNHYHDGFCNSLQVGFFSSTLACTIFIHITAREIF